MSAEQPGLLEIPERPAEPWPGPAGAGRPRLKAVDRQQIRLRPIDPERLVAEDHPVRAIWELLGQMDLSRFAAGLKAREGRPGRDASDPRVIIALWLYALSRGVREARALDEWSQYEPGCQWLLGLERINYHTLSDFVTAHVAALDQLFVQVLQVLMAAGAADLQRVAHDGTKIRAAASRKSFKRQERLAECRQLAEEHLRAVQQQAPGQWRAAQRQAQQRATRERCERVQQAQEELQRQQAEKPPAEQAQVKVSVTDAEAGIMRQADGGFAPSYNAQLSTDSTAGVIVGYDATRAKEDSHELAVALERIEQNTGRAPRQVLIDGGYTTRENIMATATGATELIGSLGESRSHAKLQQRGVSPEFFPEQFRYDAAGDAYTCPAGKLLPYKNCKRLVGGVEKHYQAKGSDCRDCPFRAQCCPRSKYGRMLTRMDEHPTVAAFREKMQQPAYERLYRQRAQVAEFSNACLKVKRGLRQFLRRGLAKVRAELAWACLSCNVAIWTRQVWKVSLRVTPAPTCA